jgi:hypothetical protein
MTVTGMTVFLTNLRSALLMIFTIINAQIMKTRELCFHFEELTLNSRESIDKFSTEKGKTPQQICVW